MKKRNIIQENIFTTIAKMIAAFQIEKKIGAAINKVHNSTEVIEAMKNLKTSTADAIKLLKDYCKRHPDDPDCKENDGEK